MNRRRWIAVAVVSTVVITKVLHARAQAKTSEDYIQDTRLAQIDSHLTHTDGMVDEHTKEIQQAELNFVAMQAASHEEDTRWHEGIIASIVSAFAALRIRAKKQSS
jgi:hypothetical protein